MDTVPLRTLQTAVGVFGGEGYTDRMDVVPLMVANAGNSNRGAISSLNCPPIIAVELCREHLVGYVQYILISASNLNILIYVFYFTMHPTPLHKHKLDDHPP